MILKFFLGGPKKFSGEGGGGKLLKILPKNIFFKNPGEAL
jgi:hypothetical protein